MKSKGPDEVMTREIEDLEVMIKQGKYDAGLLKIDALVANFTDSFHPDYLLELQLLKMDILIQKGQYQEGLLLIQELEQQTDLQEICLTKLKVNIAFSDILYYLGKFKEGLEKILTGEKFLLELPGEETAECKPELASLYKVKGKILEKLGKEDQSRECYQNSLDLFQEINDQSGIASILNNLGIIYRKQGNLKIALDYYHRSLAIRRTLDNNLDIVASLNNIGIIYMYQGHFDQALTHYQDALTILQEEDHKQYLAAIHNNLGNIYFDKGELNDAFIHYQACIDLWGELGHQQYNAYGLNHLGKIYRRKGELEEALSYYQQALELLRSIGNQLDISITLFDLISTSIDKNDHDLVQKYLEELKSINKQESNKIIDQRYRLANALRLKNDPRLRMRSKAEEMLKQVITEEIIDHEITEYAMLNLCELFIENLRLTNDKAVLKDVEQLIIRLLEVAKQQNSHWLIAESYFLRAKLFLLELNLDKAREFLGQAQIMAEEKGMKNLAIKISHEHDFLLQEIPKFHELSEKDAPLAERLEFAKLDHLINRLTRMRLLDLPELKEEEPVLVIIMAENGLSLYSKPFLPEGEINPQLFGGFLSAIHSFSEAVFSRSLDRALLGEYTLVMKSEEPLLMCYICKGQAFSALQKLNHFIQQTTRSEKDWSALTEGSRTGKTLESTQQNSLNDLVLSIFSPNQPSP